MHTNQKLLVDLLLSKGASYEVLDSYEELLEISCELPRPKEKNFKFST